MRHFLLCFRWNNYCLRNPERIWRSFWATSTFRFWTKKLATITKTNTNSSSWLSIWLDSFWAAQTCTSNIEFWTCSLCSWLSGTTVRWPSENPFLGSTDQGLRVGGELIILSRQSLVEFYLFGLMEIAIKLLGLSWCGSMCIWHFYSISNLPIKEESCIAWDPWENAMIWTSPLMDSIHGCGKVGNIKKNRQQKVFSFTKFLVWLDKLKSSKSALCLKMV